MAKETKYRSEKEKSFHGAVRMNGKNQGQVMRT
jgi:hypothetical protein